MENTVYPNSNHPPRVPPYSPANPRSFAYRSVTQRWPKILTQIIDHLVSRNNQLLDSLDRTPDEDERKSIATKLARGKAIISQISELKYEAARDKELKLLDPSSDYSDQENSAINLYNDEILKSKAAGKPTWFSASWLLTECYMYQRIHGFFNQSPEWKGFDPFEHQKRTAFQSSWDAVSSLCLSLEKSIASTSQLKQQDFKTDHYLASLHTPFAQLLNACLWGNATDLSLLPNMTEKEIKELQKNASSTNKHESVLRDDTNLTWENCFKQVFMDCFVDHRDDADEVTGERGRKRIDFVLDNSGFELFTDFVLADWIVSNSNHTIQIVFHPKLIPWFVSDVMSKDIDQLIESILDPTHFFNIPQSVEEEENQIELVKQLGLKWKSYLEDGVWKILDPQFLSFWTCPLPFWDITSRDSRLLSELKSSDLVIFKGDLNYRKLTGDAEWETDTKFEEAIGPLHGEFNLLSLRTCKADVCVGLQPGQEASVYKIDPDWRVNGKFGLITFCAKK